MESEDRNQRVKTGAVLKEKGLLLMVAIAVIHLIAVYRMQEYAEIGGDGIFSYTLANNPYSFEYIDPAYKRLPQNNGWINAHILRESYIVEDYDSFNYSSVYFHQRIDNHPLLYYSLVHTVCSLWKGTYSNLYTMAINLIFICAADILAIRLVKKIYGKYCSFVCFLFSVSGDAEIIYSAPYVYDIGFLLLLVFIHSMGFTQPGKMEKSGFDKNGRLHFLWHTDALLFLCICQFADGIYDDLSDLPP